MNYIPNVSDPVAMHMTYNEPFLLVFTAKELTFFGTKKATIVSVEVSRVRDTAFVLPIPGNLTPTVPFPWSLETAIPKFPLLTCKTSQLNALVSMVRQLSIQTAQDLASSL